MAGGQDNSEFAWLLRLLAIAAVLIAGLLLLPFRSQESVARPEPARLATGNDSRIETKERAAPKSVRLGPKATAATAPDLAALTKPQRVCDGLSTRSSRLIWRESPLFPSEWECLSDDLPPDGEPDRESGHGPASASLFAMARGKNSTGINSVRLKLSAQDADAALAAAPQLLDMAGRLFAAIGMPRPDGLDYALSTLQPFRWSGAGIDVVFSAERMEKGRYNLIVSFPAERRRPS